MQNPRTYVLSCQGIITTDDNKSLFASLRDRIPWYVRMPGVFFEKRDRPLINHIWIITGWRWSLWIIRRRQG